MGKQVHMRVGCSLLSILFRKHLSLQPELEELVVDSIGISEQLTLIN